MCQTIKEFFRWRILILFLALTVQIITADDSSSAPIYLIKPDHAFSRGRLFYRSLWLDVSSSSLYVGAMNTIYKLSVSNINDTSQKTHFIEKEIRPSQQAVSTCAYRSRDQEFQCQNYLRVFAQNENSMLVCGSNAYTPVVYRIGTRYMDIMEDSTNGAAICATGPDDNSTALWVEKGNPFDKPSIYSATSTDFTHTNRIIYRPPILSDGGEVLEPFMRTIHTDSKWLNEPQFVGSFDVGDQYVYFFFRETAVEFINCGKAIYSRVARICKKDTGGQYVMKQNWATFSKARLNCSISGEFPFYFDEIQHVVKTTQADGEIYFHAVFTTNLNGLFGSAVCAFSLKKIQDTFDQGSFKEQVSSSSNWLPVLPQQVPAPRPGQCHGSTKALSDTTLHFVKSHTLMDSVVPSITAGESEKGRNNDEHVSKPLFYKRNVVFVKIAVDQFEHENKKPTFVVFAATDRGEIYKILQGNDRNGITSKLLSVYRLVKSEPIRGLQILPHKSLFVSQDDSVSQLELYRQCREYKFCSSCSEDPYCFWDEMKDKCFGVKDAKQHIRITANQCKQKSRTVMKLAYPGETTHFSCDKVYNEMNIQSHSFWNKDGVKLTVGLQRHFFTTDGGLVITNMSSLDSGQYDCVVDGQTTVIYKVKINDIHCEMPQDVQSYRAVYKEWCREFQEYKYKMEEWSRQKSHNAQCMNKQNNLNKIGTSGKINIKIPGRSNELSQDKKR